MHKFINTFMLKKCFLHDIFPILNQKSGIFFAENNEKN